MALIRWNDSYSVKVAKLDAQHKSVIEMINNLAESMRNGQGAAAVHPTLAALTEYFRIHTEDEENSMRQSRYQELSDHMDKHRQFQLRLERLNSDLEKTGSEDAVPLLCLLRDIILEHMLETDQAYSAHLNAHGIH